MLYVPSDALAHHGLVVGLVNTFLASPCVIRDVCIWSGPIQMLPTILLDLGHRQVAMVKSLKILFIEAGWNDIV